MKVLPVEALWVHFGMLSAGALAEVRVLSAGALAEVISGRRFPLKVMQRTRRQTTHIMMPIGHFVSFIVAITQEYSPRLY